MTTRIIREAVKVIKCDRKICKCLEQMDPKFISVVDYDNYKCCYHLFIPLKTYKTGGKKLERKLYKVRPPWYEENPWYSIP